MNSLGLNHTPCPTSNPTTVSAPDPLFLSPQHDVVTITTTDCVVTSNETRMACAVPEGVGFNFTWSVCVARQCSTTPHPAPKALQTSYGPPFVVTCTAADDLAQPMAIAVTGTVGGAVITLSGANFGVDATLITVLWNGVALRDVKVRQLPPEPFHASTHSQ